MSLNTKLERSKTRAKQQEVENQQPDAYKSPYREKIDTTLDTLGAAPDVSDTVGEALNQYRQRMTENAQGAMQNAVAGNAALSGGYGNGYAASAARQGYDQSTADLGLAQNSLRAQALNEYQNQQNGLVEMLNALQTQDNIERGEAAGNLADWQQWRNYWQNRAQTARQNDQTDTQLDKVDAQYDKTQKENFWNNVWNTVTGVGSALLKGYDGYKGYTQQQWENEFNQKQFDFQKQQYADSQSRADRNELGNLYNEAFNLYTYSPEVAKAYLDSVGIGSGVLDNYTGAPVTRETQASVLATAASMVAAGNEEGAANLLKLYGMDPTAAGNYRTISGRQLSTALQKSAATKSGSSGGSGRASGGGSGNSTKSGYSTSQLLQIANKFAGMEETNPLYNYYQQVLTEAGMLDDGAGNSGKSTGSRPSQGAQLALNMGSKWGNVDGRSTETAPKTTAAARAASSGFVPMPTDRISMGQRQALSDAASGMSKEKIIDKLVGNGFTDDEIYNILKNLK